MAPKRVTVASVGPGLRLVGSTASGHSVLFDDASGDSGARPAEVLLAALGACSAMDVISILRKKRQPVASYRVRVEGEQAESHPHVFTDIRLVHELEGTGIDVVAVHRAIELSARTYCTISATLSSGVTRISHWYVVRGRGPEDDDVGEVLVTGPHLAPGDALPSARVTASQPVVHRST